ncbi:hypothetical protein NP493_3g01061 [Ridgeia piscesae]|uniref:Uncharacterized protein n=1 Tax=Ridgeia piscesae TaxID=27915 RepID=A0AAD9PFT4_RIDPI|nr:hypothetical protein NP493_3g01061 [Ridgeia piscesae]
MPWPESSADSTQHCGEESDLTASPWTASWRNNWATSSWRVWLLQVETGSVRPASQTD